MYHQPTTYTEKYFSLEAKKQNFLLKYIVYLDSSILFLWFLYYSELQNSKMREYDIYTD